MHWVFLILSIYSRVAHIPFFPRISSIFPFVNALRFASALATVNEEKEGEKEKPRIRKLSSHTVRALCPNSEWMREKRKERERKRYGQNWEKKKYLERLREWRILPFLEYGTLPRLIRTAKINYDCPLGKLSVMIGFAKLWVALRQRWPQGQSYHNECAALS